MFNKLPRIKVDGYSCSVGWREISLSIKQAIEKISADKKIIILEMYPGVIDEEVIEAITAEVKFNHIFRVESIYKTENDIRKMVERDLGDNPVFGKLSYLEIDDYFDEQKFQQIQTDLERIDEGNILIAGTGAVRLFQPDLLIYADMARWEIQQRQRTNEISNLGVNNSKDRPSWKYKWAFFIDWRVADRLKKECMNNWDFVLDTNDRANPKLVEAEAVYSGLRKTAGGPFELVPFFDPGPWGGQWMKDICGLDQKTENYAWCFNCVPEENSILLQFGEVLFEIPSINLVFFQPKELLGERVFARFGAEFPIRFDFLDTWEGGNLSLQVHPTTEYIQDKFGWHYTQDESYYMMDAQPGAKVYLGIRDDVDKGRMIKDLNSAQNGGPPFPADEYAQSWPVKKHDHVLIPAGTVHCSGENTVVLEISATPYIFTFKLWDWGRTGLDGRPRPVHIDHGEKVIQFDRTPQWTQKNLINCFSELASGDGWREEVTGLHEYEFIETRRHWFTKPVEHHTNGTLNVLNLVEGEEIIVESPEGAFESLVVHYAETFIIPAAAGAYIIRPHGPSEGSECATIKAFVR